MDVLFRKRKSGTSFPPEPNCLEPQFEVFTHRKPDFGGMNSYVKLQISGETIHSFTTTFKHLFQENLIEWLDIPEPLKGTLTRNLSTGVSIPAISKVMAIVNATPDSFYAGSRLMNNFPAIDRILDSKPDIIDIGGESTRPGSVEISPEEEIARIEPIMEYISGSSGAEISLDTRHLEVLERFADRIDYANDITGFSNETMIRIASDHDLGCIVMHMRGTPQTMNSLTEYCDLEYEIMNFLFDRIHSLSRHGIPEKNIIIDPGIGFSKNSGQNLSILRNIASFKFGYPVLMGASRKSFLGKIVNRNEESRLGASIGAAVWSALNGVDIIRVHDPEETRQALSVVSTILNRDS